MTVNGKSFTLYFDKATNTTTITTPEGRQMSAQLDSQGRVTQASALGLAAMAYSYDARGRLQAVVAGSGATARTSGYGYDASGNLTSLTDPLSRTTTVGYDADRPISLLLPGHRTLALGYDANGNVTSITPPGSAPHAFGYTPVDLRASYTAPAVAGVTSTQTSYTYDKDRQLTAVTRPDGTTVQVAYDGAGRLATVTLPRGTLTHGYDGQGRLISVTSPDGVSLGYGYDGTVQLSTTWSGPVAGSVSRALDGELRVASRSVNGANPVVLTYDRDELLTGVGALTIARDATSGLPTSTALGMLTTTQSFSPFGELASTSASAGGTGLYSTTYTRDALGRITQLDETVQGVTTSKVYSYDAAGRLWKVTIDGLLEAEYTYDENGNRLSVTDIGGTTTATYDAQDRLVSYGGTTYIHDANGDRTSKTDATGTTTTSYDALGNLVSVTLPNATSLTYVIDGQNRRVGKKVNGTLVQGWLYEDQLRIAAELDGSGAVVSRFVYAEGVNVPAYMVKGGVTYRLLTDHLGSVRLVVNSATGAVVQQMDYDAWGVVTNDTNPAFQPFGFAGGLYDQHTGWVRFGARDYDPQVGRWMAQEPVLFSGGSANLHAYAANDPVNNLDLDGRVITELAQAFLGRLGPVGALLSLAWHAGVFDIAPLEATLRDTFGGPFTRADEAVNEMARTYRRKGTCEKRTDQVKPVDEKCRDAFRGQKVRECEYTCESNPGAWLKKEWRPTLQVDPTESCPKTIVI